MTAKARRYVEEKRT